MTSYRIFILLCILVTYFTGAITGYVFCTNGVSILEDVSAATKLEQSYVEDPISTGRGYSIYKHLVDGDRCYITVSGAGSTFRTTTSCIGN